MSARHATSGGPLLADHAELNGILAASAQVGIGRYHQAIAALYESVLQQIPLGVYQKSVVILVIGIEQRLDRIQRPQLALNDRIAGKRKDGAPERP